MNLFTFIIAAAAGYLAYRVIRQVRRDNATFDSDKPNGEHLFKQKQSTVTDKLFMKWVSLYNKENNKENRVESKKFAGESDEHYRMRMSNEGRWGPGPKPSKLESLQTELDQHVATENYEKAAEVRDKINKIKSKNTTK